MIESPSMHAVNTANAAIQVKAIRKTFADKKHGSRTAVDQVSFEVFPGEIFGLLGPNGAGKTTTLRVLATLLKPTSGTAILNGFDIVGQAAEVRGSIGFLSGDMGLYGRLSPREVLRFFADLNRLPDAKARVEETIQRFNIMDFADSKIDKFSTGMKQKVAIARAMLCDPPILILDEPTSGLDVPAARAIESAILDARKRGKCIIFSTHVMEEAEYLCDRIAVINDGKIRIIGTMDQLREATGKHRLREVFVDLLGLGV